MASRASRSRSTSRTSARPARTRSGSFSADGYAAAGVLTKGNITVSGGLGLGGLGLVLPWLPAALPTAFGAAPAPHVARASSPSSTRRAGSRGTDRGRTNDEPILTDRVSQSILPG